MSHKSNSCQAFGRCPCEKGGRGDIGIRRVIGMHMHVYNRHSDLFYDLPQNFLELLSLEWFLKETFGASGLVFPLDRSQQRN